jgi:acid phosphatase (class A)
MMYKMPNALGLLLFGMLSVALSGPGYAAESKPARIFKYQMSPPPVPGSDEDRQDFTALHRYQDHRTPEQCEVAGSQSKFRLSNTFGPETGILTAAEIKKVRGLSARVISKVATVTFYFKKKFKRLRPYNADTSLQPCIKKAHGDTAYPSGHAATGLALALAFAKVFPEKREAILKQGYQIGENRLIGGVHHPSDVKAGQDLAKQVIQAYPITL